METLSREKFIIISANTSCLDVNINSETIRGWFVNSVVADARLVCGKLYDDVNGPLKAFVWEVRSMY